MADVTAGTKTCAFGDSCYGQQNSTDRLGRSDPQRTIYTANGLKEEEEQRVSKTREMMVHKSAAKNKTPRRKSRA